jgi:hypothetical protein
MEKLMAYAQAKLLGSLATFFVNRFCSSVDGKLRLRLRAVFAALTLGLAPAANALQLTIAWDVNSTGELGFNIERSSDGTNFAQVATVAAGVSSYTDLNLPTGTYWYRVRAFNASTYSPYSNVASTQTAVSAPSFTAQPASQSVATGSSVTFSAAASGSPSPSLQWKKNGVSISGATSQSLTLNPVSSADTGTYTIVATNSAGSVTSIGAVLTLTTVTPVEPPPVEIAPASFIGNFSARALPGKGGQSINMKFGVKSGDASILVRAIGPGLAAFTSLPTFADPKLALNDASGNIANNDNWGGSSALSTVFTQVGAFPLASTSKDSAILQTLAEGNYSADISGKAGGVAMIEVYDADAAGGHLSEVKVAGPVGTGDQRLIGGFTITGTESLRVLIRAIGPSLGGRNALNDPQLEIHRGTTLVGRNDNWGGSTALSSGFTLAGASTLASGSKDAAIDLTLAPGTYTATVSGVNSTTGSAQLELYEIR